MLRDEQHYMQPVYKEIIWDGSHFNSVKRVGTHRKERRGFLKQTLITSSAPGLREADRPETARKSHENSRSSCDLVTMQADHWCGNAKNHNRELGIVMQRTERG